MLQYRQRTGERVTYADLARMTKLAPTTVQAIGSRRGYNASLKTIEALCRALGCTPADLLELRDDPRASRTPD